MLRTVLAMCAALGLLWLAAEHLKFSPGARARETSQTSEPGAPEEQQRHLTASKPRLFEMGDTVRVGYWTYRCNGAGWMPFVGDSRFDLERADANFLIVDLTIENNDRTPSTLPPARLIDAEGREYEQSSKAFLLQGAFDVWKKLNPDVRSRGFILFDVPDGRKYTLVLSGGFHSGQTALIDVTASEHPFGGAGRTPSAAPPPDSAPSLDASPQ